MLNHLNKYTITETMLNNDFQTISYAVASNDSNKRFFINQLNKNHLSYAIDVTVIIESLRHLIMLEEDPFSWYLITEIIPANPLTNLLLEKEALLSSDLDSNEVKRSLWEYYYDQIQRLVRLVKRYASLPIAFQSLMISPSNLRLTPSGLDSLELLVLGDSSNEILTEADYVASLNQMMSSIFLVSESLEDLHAQYSRALDASIACESIEAWCSLWQTGIEKAPLQASVLNNLYAVSSESTETPSSVRRISEQNKQRAFEAQLESERTRPEKNTNSAILITGFVCVLLLGIIFIPKLLNPPVKTTPDQASATHQSDNTKKTEPTAQTPDSSAETLDLNNIILEGNGWQIDQKHFHTGDKSIQLQINSKNELNKLTLAKVKLSKDSNLSFWAMSDSTTPVNLTLKFLNSNGTVHESSYTLSFNAANTWYLFNPFDSLDFKSIEKVEQIQIVFQGEPCTLWLDDFSLETIK